MNYAEVNFLKAEAALRGWAGAGDAAANYKAGIQASFDEACAGVDPALVPTTDDETYINGGSVKWDNGVDFEGKLEKIITQKWISMYPNATAPGLNQGQGDGKNVRVWWDTKRYE